MKTRLDVFRELQGDAHYGRLWKRLTRADIDQIELFIKENDHLNSGDFFSKQKHLYLGKQNLSKNWALIDEMLCVANRASLFNNAK